MIYLNLDLSAILDLKEELRPRIQRALNDAARDLAIQSHAHIVESVQEKLHSTREKYLGAMSFDQVSESTWVISLDKSAMWIEEGMSEHEMIDDLLKSSKAKTGKDGSKFLSVPFQHNKGPTQQTQAQKDLTDTIKSELSRRQIPYGKLEMDAEGKPKTGLLHSFDIMKAPVKTGPGAGQGKGPVGQVRQGPTGVPFLQGIRIYQKQIKNAQGKTSVARSIMTFRTVSSKMKGSGRWVHPGMEARNFFDEAATWALDQWQTKIVPRILEQVSNGG